MSLGGLRPTDFSDRREARERHASWFAIAARIVEEASATGLLPDREIEKRSFITIDPCHIGRSPGFVCHRLGIGCDEAHEGDPKWMRERTRKVRVTLS